MKLITEKVNDAKFLTEETGGKKNYFLEGTFLQSELQNRNGRIYPKHILEREVNRYIKEYVEPKRAFGELGHPDSPTINLDRVSHMIVSLKEDGNNFIGKAKILDTPMGRIVKNLIDEGAMLGVSSRGMGSLKAIKEAHLVQDDYYLATAADIVADPSAPDALMHGIMEGKEWVWGTSGIQEVDLTEMKTQISKAKQKQLDEIALNIFKNFISKL